MGAMKIMKNRNLVLASFLVGVLASISASADTLPEYGFRGVKRIELAFVNVAVAGGAPAQKAATPAAVPADDLLTGDLAKNEECKAIGRTLKNAGLEVVEKCKPDDLDCGKLYLTVENHSRGRTAERIYLIGVELSQPLTLSRDDKVVLAQPTTWSEQSVEVVANDKSATEAACIAFRSLGTWFGTHWKLANK